MAAFCILVRLDEQKQRLSEEAGLWRTVNVSQQDIVLNHVNVLLYGQPVGRCQRLLVTRSAEAGEAR
jgi:hypothetical protein